MRKLFIILLVILFSCDADNPEPADIRDKYTGVFTTTESWVDNYVSFESNFNVIIEKSATNPSRIFILNFSNYGVGVSANLDVDGNMFTIPMQQLSNSVVVSGGEGSISGESISFRYNVLYRPFDINVEAVRK